MCILHQTTQQRSKKLMPIPLTAGLGVAVLRFRGRGLFATQMTAIEAIHLRSVVADCNLCGIAPESRTSETRLRRSAISRGAAIGNPYQRMTRLCVDCSPIAASTSGT